MIFVDQCRITDDGQAIILDAHINKAEYFDNMYIESIAIDTQDTVRETFDDASDNKIYFNLICNSVEYNTTEIVKNKEVHLILNKNDFNENFKGDISDNLFFIYIKAGGVPSPNTPCRLDENPTVVTTFDYGLIYNQMMQYTKELEASCSIPEGFIDMILRFEALKVSLESEHYVPAIKYFKYFISGGNSVTAKPCGCYGGFNI